MSTHSKKAQPKPKNPKNRLPHLHQPATKEILKSDTDYYHALKTYYQMDQLGTPRSSVSFNALLSACNQSKLFDKVPELFDEISAKYRVLPDKVSYGILVKSLCEAGKPEKAGEVLELMERKGVDITKVTFTTILDAWYKIGEREEGDKLWSEIIGFWILNYWHFMPFLLYYMVVNLFVGHYMINHRE